MKKLMLLVALLALGLVAAAPALAQVSNSVKTGGSDSGSVTDRFTVSNTGDNSDQCATAEQFSNTGNNQNAQGALQYASDTGSLGFSGGGFEFKPSNTQTCTQQVQQSSAASSG